MPRPVDRFIEWLFFRNVRMPPRPEWKEQFRQWGEAEPIAIPRGDHHLAAQRLSGPSPRNRLAVLAHPISRKGKYFFNEGRRIQHYLDRGYDILAFDYNGFGESPRIDCFFWQDARAVLTYCNTHWPLDHLIFHGLSFGAFQAARAFSALPDQASVVFENVNRTLLDYWKQWWIPWLALKFLSTVGWKPLKEMNAQSSLQELDRPDLNFLFIACGSDEFCKVEELEHLAACAGPQSHIEIFPKAGHFGAPESDPDHYRRALDKITRAT